MVPWIEVDLRKHPAVQSATAIVARLIRRADKSQTASKRPVQFAPLVDKKTVMDA
jgi:hypothetical protein